MPDSSTPTLEVVWDNAPVSVTDTVNSIVSNFGINEGQDWLVIGAAPRDALPEADDVRQVAKAIGRLGGLALRLMCLHRSWELAPGAVASFHSEKARRLDPQVREVLERALGLDMSPAIDSRGAVGALVVLGAYQDLFGHLRNVRAPPELASYKSALQEYAAEQRRGEPTYSMHRSGPPHDPAFVSAVELSGLSVHGHAAGSKRGAQDHAARAWLERHAEHWLAKRLAAKPRLPSLTAVTPARASSVRRPAAELGLPPELVPLLSAALVTRSAANKDESSISSGLAQLGAAGVEVGVALVLAEAAGVTSASADGDQLWTACAAPEFVASALRSSSLLDLLIGEGATTRQVADAAQAVAGALVVAGIAPNGILERLARVGVHLGPDARRVGPVRRNAKMVLQELLVKLGADVRYEPGGHRGPPHDRQHRSLVTIETRLEAFKFRGPWGESRRESDRKAAAIALRALSLDTAIVANKAAAQVARSLLGALSSNSPVLRDRRRIDPTMFPVVGWAADTQWSRVATWFETVSTLIDAEVVASWRLLVARHAEWSRYVDDRAITEACVLLAQQVRALDASVHEDVPSGLSRLLHNVADHLRAASRPHEFREISDVVAELQLLFGRRHRLAFSGELSATILERRGTLLMFCEQTLRRAPDAAWEFTVSQKGQLVNIELRSDKRLRPIPEHGLVKGLQREMPIEKIEYSDYGMNLAWLRGAVSDRRWYDDAPSHAADLASALHDLKNGLSAFAFASTQPAATTTDRLKAKALASEHLDAAKRVMARVLALTEGASSMADPEEVDVAALLHAYISDFGTRRPPGVAIDVPALSSVKALADPALLRTAIDNLTKNAIEAMHADGKMSFAISADEQSVRVVIADTGPGFDRALVAAFDSGGHVESTKRGGTALGLASVRAALRRFDSRLLLSSTTDGAIATIEMRRV